MAYELEAFAVEDIFDGGSAWDGSRDVSFEIVIVGNLQVTTGHIVACDPFVAMGAQPFLRTVAAGSYRTTVAIAAIDDDERIAFARVDFADVPVDRYVLATVAGQDAGTLGPDAFFGYGVDSGTGCFMDAEAGSLLEARMREEPDFFERIIASMDLTYRHTRSWAPVRPNDDRPENVLCFSSGFGDGSYPTFYGLGADGELVALVTDFLVLARPGEEDPPGSPGSYAVLTRRPWWKFWG